MPRAPSSAAFLEHRLVPLAGTHVDVIACERAGDDP